MPFLGAKGHFNLLYPKIVLKLKKFCNIIYNINTCLFHRLLCQCKLNYYKCIVSLKNTFTSQTNSQCNSLPPNGSLKTGRLNTLPSFGMLQCKNS